MMTVDVPGAFDTYFSGTGVVAGQPYSDDADTERGAQELRTAWEERRVIRRGRGYTMRLELPSTHAVLVLAEHGEWCLSRNSDEPDYSEVAAAWKVIDRCAAADPRIVWDGYSVTLDGRRT
jgi:hypothetical protein